jgi:hypothetical protein
MSDDKQFKKNPSERQEFLGQLVKEWKLFWHSLVGEEDLDEKENFPEERIQELNSVQIKHLIKELSQSRQNLNRELEEIKSDLDYAMEKQDNLKLVGSDTTELESEIQELYNLGEIISDKLARIDDRLRLVRSLPFEAAKE